MKTRVYLIFGGRSGEHEVSLMSARNVMEALDQDRYEVVPIGITKEGRWLLTGDPMKALLEGVERAGGMPVALLGDPTLRSLVPVGQTDAVVPPAAAPGVPAVFFPVLHGPFGEDGTIQGLLEMAGVPYVGCGVLASSAGMDKAIAKALFAQAGLRVVPAVTVLRSQWEGTPADVICQVEARFGYPVFVKPANLGSSVGVSKAKDRAGLTEAIHAACRFDRRVLVEQAVNAREIELAILGNDEPFVSIPGEIVPGAEFYSYEDKYFDDKSEARIPADLSPEQVREVQQMGLTAYRAIDAAGMARVDFFLDKTTGEFYINEVNTIPGFTRISMFPKLMEASGLPYPKLVDRLIELSLERWQEKQRTTFTLGPDQT